MPVRLLREDWNRRLALVAAVLFLVQALAGASALAAGRTQVPLDAFGNPICMTGTDHGVPDGGGDHGKMPGCCMLGCGVASSLASPPETTSFAIGFASEFKPFMPKAYVVFAPDDEHDPNSPRAPPALT
ncbi:hypothetical protein RB623_04465 [Mesorhizobium sp. LHD-90]|uniref:hypothetical protein n=1 Tax=Mesorhizobium sp. LHD-90 TaxID=3071414 RepID=UPI0027E1340C|nr:hypothetical protein [Mesorhizobium sp. LHD-90]MDQ6433300.1 hypothetical protein [Mesorhizobium sp. LHD-90]